jgi:hypothetical protein
VNTGELTRTADAAVQPQTGDAAMATTRVAAIIALTATAALLSFIAVTGYHAVTDAWAAPIHLSPDNDHVLQLELKLEHQRSELARVEAEVARIDAQVDAIDQQIAKLEAARDSFRQSMSWEADVQDQERATYDRMIANLESQGQLLASLRDRQQKLTDDARSNLEAGLIDRTELERQEQALDSLRVSLAENRRQLEEARMRRRESAVASSAFSSGGKAPTTGAAMPQGRMPEVIAGEEQHMRLELQLLELRGERTGQLALRAVATDRVARERELLGELQDRPLYRAMHASTNIAFIPYDQLEGVTTGARVLSCVWSLFACDQVGVVGEILPGEVVTKDPWGDLARGQYAMLDLSEPAAVRERVLRIRP